MGKTVEEVNDQDNHNDDTICSVELAAYTRGNYCDSELWPAALALGAVQVACLQAGGPRAQGSVGCHAHLVPQRRISARCSVESWHAAFAESSAAAFERRVQGRHKGQDSSKATRLYTSACTGRPSQSPARFCQSSHDVSIRWSP